MSLFNIPKEVLEHHLVPLLPLISCIRFLSTCTELWTLGTKMHNLQDEILFWKRKIKRQEIHEAHALALENKEYEIVKLLEPRCVFWKSSIKSAIKLGDLELVKRYQSKLDPNMAKFSNEELSCWAGRFGHKHIIQYFTESHPFDLGRFLPAAARSGYLDIITMYPEIPAPVVSKCVVAASCGGHKNVIEFFLAGNVELTEKILFYAAYGGNKDVVDIFIARGYQNWNLGLQGAACGNHKKLVEFFVKAGATNVEELVSIKAWLEIRAKFLWSYARKIIS